MKRSKDTFADLDELNLPDGEGYAELKSPVGYLEITALSEQLLSRLQSDPAFEQRRLQTKCGEPFTLKE